MSLLSFNKINRESVTQQVYDSIKRRIIEGTLPPGTHLIETTIAEQMATSRGPVREALRLLEVEGLVEVRANVGTFVRSLPVKEIEEIYTVRSILEAYAAKLAAEKANPQSIENLHRIKESVRQAAERGDLKETVWLDFELHRQIWKIADHSILQDLLSHLEPRVRMFISLQAPLFERLMDSIQDHQAIVEAIENKECEKASKLIQEHIILAGDLIIRHMMEVRNE